MARPSANRTVEILLEHYSEMKIIEPPDHYFFSLVVALALGATAAIAEDRGVSPAPDDQPSVQSEFNNGEDFTRPVRLLQLRERYENLPNTKGLNPEKWQTTLRTDIWNGLGEGWKLYGRADAPLVYSNDVTSRFNPEGKAKFGQGDLLTEAVLIPPPPSPRLSYGVGIRAIWPTASLDEVGQGKYQLGPIVGVRFDLPEITPGSYFLPEVFYLNSVASRDHNQGRADINQLNIQPKFNLHLPDQWFATAYASEQIQINFADDNKLFLPFDLMLGRKLAENFIVSLEYSRVMFHDKGFEPYQWQLEARLGFYY
jgi:hypothetical protein